MNNYKGKTKTITQIALFSALQCVISPFAIAFPLSPVPISLATLMLYLSSYILGKNRSVISCGIYLLIGLVGLPVFSGFTGGIGKVFGPTGGYILGYLFLVYISGWFFEKWSIGNRQTVTKGRTNAGCNWNSCVSFMMHIVGMVFGTMACYLFGSFWLAYQSQMSVTAALTAGVLPFIPGDIAKIIVAATLGANIKRRLIKAGVL